jgi:hypothetical protein
VGKADVCDEIQLILILKEGEEVVREGRDLISSNKRYSI